MTAPQLFPISKFGAIFDAHTHSYFDFHDGRLSPKMIVKCARKRRFNWICGMTHDKMYGMHRLKVAAQDAGFPFLSALEISTNYNHILAYGIQEWRWAHDCWDPEVVIERLREQGCAVYASHPPVSPYWDGGPWNNLVHELDFDGIEWINAMQSVINWKTWHMFRDYPKGRIGGSDAHGSSCFGDAFTQIPTTSVDPDDLVTQLRRGRCRPGGSYTPPNRLLTASLSLEIWHKTVRKMEVEGRWIKEHWERRGIQPAHYRSGKAWRAEFLAKRGKRWDARTKSVVMN